LPEAADFGAALPACAGWRALAARPFFMGLREFVGLREVLRERDLAMMVQQRQCFNDVGLLDRKSRLTQLAKYQSSLFGA